MKKRSIAVCTITIATLVSLNPAIAQVGGGTTGGTGGRGNTPGSTFVGPTVPPTSNATTQTFSTARYLNGGDFIGAQSAQAAINSDHMAGTQAQNLAQTGGTNPSNFNDFFGAQTTAQQPAAGTTRYDFARVALTTADAAAYQAIANQVASQSPASSSGNLSAPNRFPLDYVTLPNNPGANSGSRPSSRAEQAAISSIRSDVLPLLQQNVNTARELVTAANQSGVAALIDSANDAYLGATRQLRETQSVLQIASVYSGRAFANDGDATRYLSALSEVQQLPHSANANIDQYGQLSTDIRSAYGGTIGGNVVNPDTRRSLQESIARSQQLTSAAISAAARAENVARTPAERAQQRAQYGDNRDLVPTFNQVRDTYTIQVQNPPTNPTEQNADNNNNRNNNNANTTNSNRTNNSQANNGSANTAAPAPVAMPRQPDGTVSYPTYQGPSQAELDRRHAAAQAAARQVDPNSQTGQTVTTAQVPDTDGDDNPTAADTSVTDATTGGHVEVTPYNATDGALAGIEAIRQAAAEEAAARARQGNARNFANNAMNTAVANTRQITGGGSFGQARLASIYQGYNPNQLRPGSYVATTMPSSAGTSLSAAGYSLSAAGISPSSAGRSNSAGGNVGFSYAGVGGVSSASNGFSLVTQGLSLATYGFSLAGGPFVAGNLGLDDPAMRGLGANDVSNPWVFAPAPRNRDTAAALLRGSFQIQNDPLGRYGRETGGIMVANLFDDQTRNMNELVSNGIGGLNALLAQPFNVVLTWGAGAYDLDLHMTGPTGEGQTDRFHIYYADRGTQTAFPFAELIKDCICNSGSEVILTAQLIRGGVYRISAFNFGDQSTTSFNLSDLSDAEIYIVRGGTATAQGNGTTIVGGRVIYRGRVPRGKAGNTWNAVEIDARNGRIIAPNIVGNSGGSGGVN